MRPRPTLLLSLTALGGAVLLLLGLGLGFPVAVDMDLGSFVGHPWTPRRRVFSGRRRASLAGNRASIPQSVHCTPLAAVPGGSGFGSMP